MASARPRAPGTTIQSVDRAVDILQALESGDLDGLALVEIARRTGLNSSTVHHLLSTMVRRQIVEKDPVSSKYRLGIGLIKLGSKAARGSTFVTAVEDHVEELSEITRQHVGVIVFHGFERESLLSIDNKTMIIARSAPLLPSTLHATASGKLLLARLEEPELAAFFQSSSLARFTENTITSAEILAGELDAVRKTGLAEDREEYFEGICCMAGAISDASGRVIGCLDLVYPKLITGNYASWRVHVRRIAAEMSASLAGYGIFIER